MYEDEDLQEIHEDIIELNEDISVLRKDLNNISASVEGTGENVILNKTAEARFKTPPLPMGNSEQVSYEGYNIININNQVNRTDSGVEITADAEKQTIKFNGTIDNTYCTSAKLALSEPLSTGVLRANFNSKCDAFIVFRASDDTWLKSIQSSNNSAIDISTLSKPVTHIQFGIEHLTSGTNVNYEVGYQLTEGNELKPYEPYVGGTASPNPDYPQEIENVEGKNLLKCVLPDETTKDGLTITRNSDGSFMLNGTSTANGRFNITSTAGKLYFTLQELGFFEGDKGFLSGCPSGGNVSTPTTSYKIFMSGLSGASNINDDGSGAIINANSSNMNGKFYIAIDYALGVTFNNLVFKPMIVKGITTKTEYVPYNSIQIKVQNKNLFDKENANVLNANLDGGVVNVISNSRTVWIKCKPNTAYVISKLISQQFQVGTTETEPQSGTTVMQLTGTKTTIGDREYIALTTNATANYLLCRYVNIFQDDDETIRNTIMIEQGTVVTSYEPHKEQSFLFPLAEGQKLMLGDYLADDGIHHVRGQATFDGSEDESWNYEELSYGNNFYINISNANGGDEIPILSNYFKYYEHGQLTPNYSCRISASKNLNLRHQDFTNVNDFKTWLSTHNVIVEYLLNEEVIVPYTTAQQEVYNQIKRAISYEEQTNISNNTIALFEVKAFRNMNATVENLQARIDLLNN